MRFLPLPRHVASEPFAVALLVASLVATAVVPAATRAARCAGDAEASSQQTLAWASDGDAADTKPTSGIDLEVRLFNLRIEFPWMKALPIRPGHHVVITMLASDREPGR